VLRKKVPSKSTGLESEGAKPIIFSVRFLIYREFFRYMGKGLNFMNISEIPFYTFLPKGTTALVLLIVILEQF